MKRRRLEAFWESFHHLLFYGVVELVILYLAVVLAFSGFFDVKAVASVVLTELAIGVGLYYVLGERRRSHIAEVVNLVDVVEKFSHLKVYTFSVFPRPFRYTFYFVENTETKQYYKAPKYLEELVEEGIIATEKECKNEAEMKKILEKNGSQANDREPSFIELKALKRVRPKSKQNPYKPNE
jgi:uncharacterized membrane protein